MKRPHRRLTLILLMGMTWGENQASQTLVECQALIHVRLFCDPKDAGSPVHGLLQARIVGWVAIPFSRGASGPGTKTGSPALQVDSLPSEPPGSLVLYVSCYLSIKRTQGCQDLRQGMPLTRPQGPVLPSLFLPSIWHKLSRVSLSLGSCLQFCNLRHQEHMGSFIKIPTPRPVPAPIELEFQTKSPSSSG